jgi:hypothetical protein
MKDCAINLSLVLVFGIGGAVLLVWSAWSGRAITQGGLIYRSKQPIGFWIVYTIWAGFALLCFWAAVSFALRGGVCPALAF